MDIFKSYIFKRIESDGRHFPKYVKKLYHCSKFDIYDNNEHLVTFLTDDYKGCAIISGLIKIKLKTSWAIFDNNQFWLTDENDKILATIEKKKSGLFGKRHLSINFEGDATIYSFEVFDKKKRKETGAVFGYDFFANDEHKCRVINLKKPPKWSFQGSLHKWEGTIDCSPETEIEKVVCFLQLINIDTDVDIS